MSLLKNAERGADRRSFRHHKGILIVPVSGPKPRLYPRRKPGLSGPPALPRRTGRGVLANFVGMLNNLYGIRPRPWRPPRRLRGARRRSPPSWPRPVLAEAVFRHACKLGLEGIVSKRKDSPYRSGRSPDWLKMKNPDAPAVKREAEKDWGKDRWR